MPCMPLCQRGLCANVLVCQRGLCANMPKACQLLIFTCQHANKRANVPYGMPNDVPIFHLGMPCAKKHANFSNISLAKY